ncbi:MAG: C-terminal binding protein [Planctomycetaceae bacterium]
MSTGFRILITDRAWPNCEIERELFSQIGAEIIEAPATDEATLSSLAADVDAILTCWAEVTPAVIQASPNCRVISRFGIGLDNICLETATSRQIPVTYVPDYCLEEVAEHTLALLFSLGRKIAFYHQQAKQNIYDRQAGPELRRMSEQTLGLVGFGRIAQTVFRKAQSLGFTVVAHSLSGNDRGTGCRMVDLEELLRTSDYVSLHLPLTERSHRMFGADQFQMMKSSAFLINTSRGGLIDHAALWEAIQEGELAGAGLDVFDPEPPDLSDPLFQDERVIVTPHAAFLSRESLVELRRRTCEQTIQVLQGEKPAHLANPQVWPKSV